jgi:hypothetical protein
MLFTCALAENSGEGAKDRVSFKMLVIFVDGEDIAAAPGAGRLQDFRKIVSGTAIIGDPVDAKGFEACAIGLQSCDYVRNRFLFRGFRRKRMWPSL